MCGVLMNSTMFFIYRISISSWDMWLFFSCEFVTFVPSMSLHPSRCFFFLVKSEWMLLLVNIFQSFEYSFFECLTFERWTNERFEYLFLTLYCYMCGSDSDPLGSHCNHWQYITGQDLCDFKVFFPRIHAVKYVFESECEWLCGAMWFCG